MIRIGNNCRGQNTVVIPWDTVGYRGKVAVGAVGALRNVRVNA